MPAAINSKNIKYPNTFSIFKGSTSLASDIKAINQSIRLILTTAKGELFGDPKFGCRLHEFVFDYAGSEVNQAIKSEIVSALNQQEPRVFIEEDDIQITTVGTTLEIDLTYSLRYTDLQSTYKYVVSLQEDN